MARGFEELYNSVIKEGFLKKSICTACGACVAVCPIDLLDFRETFFYESERKESYIDKSELEEIFKKCINCELCYDACPEIDFNLSEIERKIYGEIKYNTIGFFRRAYSAQSTNDEFKLAGQAGGVVTSILKYLLDNDIVDGVVVAVGDKSNPWKPIPKVITKDNIAELKQSQKSKYFPSAILVGVKHAIKKMKLKSVAVTVLPCQMHAITKMRLLDKYKNFVDKIKVTVGLFCYGTYWSHKFFEWLDKHYKVTPEAITKMSFSHDGFIIELRDGTFVHGSRERIYSILKESCKHCQDFTNVLADISIGNMGVPPDHSAVFVRTTLGLEIIKKAEQEHYITIQPLSEDGFKTIYEISLLKFKYHVGKKAFKISTGELKQKIKQLNIPTIKDEGMLAIYVIANTGLPIYSRQFSTVTKNVDQAIVAGVTSAIIEYTRSVFGGDYVKEIALGSYTLLIERGKNVSLIALLKKDCPLIKKIKKKDILAEIVQKLDSLDELSNIENIKNPEILDEKIDEVVRDFFIVL
ncbi:MAG: Coenzyme F420 hydrogenase/dehydrogenase, beta subunit C-terminal domain [Candidatus Asgardarchaeia archaeon]